MEKYVAEIEKSLLQAALAQSNGVQTRAADVLRISYRSFRHLMKKYDLVARRSLALVAEPNHRQVKADERAAEKLTPD